LKLKSIVIPPNKMTGSGEKHAQDKNLIWCILVALRPILLLTVYINTLYISLLVLFLYQEVNISLLLHVYIDTTFVRERMVRTRAREILVDLSLPLRMEGE